MKQISRIIYNNKILFEFTWYIYKYKLPLITKIIEIERLHIPWFGKPHRKYTYKVVQDKLDLPKPYLDNEYAAIESLSFYKQHEINKANNFLINYKIKKNR